MIVMMMITTLIWLRTDLHWIGQGLGIGTMLYHGLWVIRQDGLRDHPRAWLGITPISQTLCLYHWPHGQSLGRYPIITPLYAHWICVHAQPRKAYGRVHTTLWLSAKQSKQLLDKFDKKT